jgi:CheY-like chemotaxis protein
LDLIMPEMDGVETYHELRKLAPTLPIVICSGYDSNEVSSSITDDEHAGFLHKPYKPDQLLNQLSKFMDIAGQPASRP